MSNTITIKNLQKTYGEHVVLDGIDLEIQKGQIYALLGASGSGKSTLLKCLNLLETPTAGTLNIHGLKFDFAAAENITPKDILTLRKKVGMVFQNFNLWPHLTVEENLMLAPMQVLKQNKDVAQKHAEKLLKKVGLSEKATTYPHKLSGGQQQRVAIARALMMKPDVLLFDEPTSALDPENVKEVLKVMQALAEEGTTMLVASHEIGFAKNVATHALFLENGKIIEHGVAKVILTNPKTDRLRSFLDAVYH
jgi:ABC-type polar amino acid transport system ATPase subunit